MKRSIQRFLATVALLGASFSSVQALPSGANIQLWFKADAGVTTNGSGNVSTWADQSGNGNNATNLTLANQPLWIDNVLNGKPVVRFDGVNDVLSTLNNVNITNGLSIFIVAKNAVRKDYNGLFRLDPLPFETRANLEIYWQKGNTDAGSGNSIYVANRDAGNLTISGLFQVPDAKPPVNNYYVMDVLASGAGATQRIQGATIGTTSSSTFRPTNSVPAHLGIGFGSTGGTLNGDIAEVIVYNTALSASDRFFVESYLADTYGLTIPEPTTMVYLSISVAGLLIVRHRRHGSS